jgi:hypothetical protein
MGWATWNFFHLIEKFKWNRDWYYEQWLAEQESDWLRQQEEQENERLVRLNRER